MEVCLRFFTTIIDFIRSAVVAILESAIFYMVLPFFLSAGILYWYWFTPSAGDGNLRAIDTPYSMRISHYAGLNRNGLCGTYKAFVNDYVIYRQSERVKRHHNGNLRYVITGDLSNQSKRLLTHPKFGHYFQNAKEHFDEVKVRHSDVGNDYYTKMFVASDVVDQDRFFLDVMTSGSTYGGKYQPHVFSTIEYNRCVDLESEFGYLDRMIYAIEKQF
ncbi:hypothetical protein [Vibrio alginolyticus]|uniref:hypothetical protein n=1 Tax=Vibrio alginolyticus TaxID=663 RepID=UPI001BD53184|nr:hypothetical protein [Vibrio alginolyticus]MBS9922169.1 hypothetical protein [Vibrio alginolyticus]